MTDIKQNMDIKQNKKTIISFVVLYDLYPKNDIIHEEIYYTEEAIYNFVRKYTKNIIKQLYEQLNTNN